jgi:hypothetical protein
MKANDDELQQLGNSIRELAGILGQARGRESDIPQDLQANINDLFEWVPQTEN